MLSLNNGVFLKLCPESHPYDDVLQSMGSQRVGHNWVTKLNALLYFSWQIFKWRLVFFPFIFVLPSMLVEKAMAPHSSTLAWRVPRTEEPGGLQSMGLQRVGHDWATSLSCIGEGNGNPLQCSCLENPRDGRAWWAAVYGVSQCRTWLKRLSSSSSMLVGFSWNGTSSIFSVSWTVSWYFL